MIWYWNTTVSSLDFYICNVNHLYDDGTNRWRLTISLVLEMSYLFPPNNFIILRIIRIVNIIIFILILNYTKKNTLDNSNV